MSERKAAVQAGRRARLVTKDLRRLAAEFPQRVRLLEPTTNWASVQTAIVPDAAVHVIA